MRVNVGSGPYPMYGWVNIDNSPKEPVDVLASALPMPFLDGSLDEVYAGHFVEHLTYEEAQMFIGECSRVLKPGGRLGIVVPDTREVMRRYLDPEADSRVQFPYGTWHNTRDLDNICRLFLYSTVQDSGHKWSYDRDTLARLIEDGGLSVTGEINRWMDPRIKVGAWYQFGLDAVKVQ